MCALYAHSLNRFKKKFAKGFGGCRLRPVNGLTEGFSNRIRALVGVAGSQRRLADLIGVRDGTVIGWLAGAEPYERNLAKIAEVTGVALDWLRNGRGNEEEELSSFRRRLTLASLGDKSARVQETPDMECPIFSGSPIGVERHMDQAAAEMDAAALSGWITRILRDTSSPDRHRVALRLLPKLAERLTAEQKKQQARH